jgi:beta-lactamase class A
MIKVPIMLALFQRIHDGELDYHEELTYSVEREYPGEDLLAAFQDGKQISLQKLVVLMISFSDNTASLWCQDLAGGGEGVNRWLRTHGFEGTRVNSRTPGREEAYEAYGWGQTTPREIAEMLVRIRSGTMISPAASEEMYRVLSKSFWDGEALSAIPPDVAAAAKQGAVNRSRSEVVLVAAPSGAYVFSVITKNQDDTSWDADNAGFVLLRDVSRLLWEHFEPDIAWRPAENVEQYW